MRSAIMKIAVVMAVFATLMIACRKNVSTEETAATPTQDALDKIYALGFSNKDVKMDEDGNYIVEGDILLNEEDLNAKPAAQLLRIGDEEQYRTTNLVRPLPRIITVALGAGMPASYGPALDEAIRRYNAENLRIIFRRVLLLPNINIINQGGSFLASAGFPTALGQPYNQVKVNVSAMAGQPLGTVATVLAHEIGHCIGFRHTDFMNRSYSCGGAAVNEGAAGVGAIHIPGTPTGPNAGSWMLSCIGSGQNRPFTAYDKIALAYVY